MSPVAPEAALYAFWLPRDSFWRTAAMSLERLPGNCLETTSTMSLSAMSSGKLPVDPSGSATIFAMSLTPATGSPGCTRGPCWS